jgi:hypothetical protein
MFLERATYSMSLQNIGSQNIFLHSTDIRSTFLQNSVAQGILLQNIGTHSLLPQNIGTHSSDITLHYFVTCITTLSVTYIIASNDEMERFEEKNSVT